MKGYLSQARRGKVWEVLRKKLLLNVSYLNIAAFFQALADNRFGFPMESHFSVNIDQIVMDVDSNFSFLKSYLLSPNEFPYRGDYSAGVVSPS